VFAVPIPHPIRQPPPSLTQPEGLKADYREDDDLLADLEDAKSLLDRRRHTLSKTLPFTPAKHKQKGLKRWFTVL